MDEFENKEGIKEDAVEPVEEEKTEPDHSEDILKQRREKVSSNLKNILTENWIPYIILILIIWFSAFIRTRNLPLLGNKWLLALDPYVFYRYAQYIVDHGKLMVVDYMRNYPMGVETSKMATLLAYVIAYMYKFFSFFDKGITLWQVTVLYPVIFFVLALVVFFFLMRRLFDYRIALFSVAFLAFIPSFLYRTMAGFSDKEALGIFLMFLTFYFFVVGWQAKTNKTKLLFGVLSGFTTVLMGLGWGAVSFLTLIIPGFIFIEVIFNKLKKGDFLVYTGWFIVFFLGLGLFTDKYGGVKGLIGSWTFSVALLIWFVALMLFVLPKIKFFERLINKLNKKIPNNIIYIIFSIILVFIIVLLVYGPSFIVTQFSNVVDNFLIHPAGVNRFQLTVAEGHQPYFTTWIGQFGWAFFWLFFLGSIALFWRLVRPIVKHRVKFTVVYTIFISAFIFSRYSASAVFNGENFISKFVYAGSLIFFLIFTLWFYLKDYNKDKDSYFKFNELEKSYIFLFVWFILMIVSGRTAIRLLFVFSPAACFMGAYSLVALYDWAKNHKDKIYKYLSIAAIILICYLTLFTFAQQSYNQSKYTGPSYNQQWQVAGNWVEGNIQEDAVFAHWWDYGYWVQTGWNRATVTDGGNMFGYWNYLLGRHFLTGQSSQEALEFLYAHNVTHALIISDEIGKYGAYSSIGGDADNDRLSYIPTFALNPGQSQETRNGTLLLYQGGFPIDEDMTYQGNLIPRQHAMIAGVLLNIETNNNITSFKQPTFVLIYQGNQIKMTLGCVWFQGREYNFDDADYGGCLRVIPTIDRGTGQMNPFGAALFVSEKVRNTIMARLLLFEEDIEGFNLVYDDSNQMPLALLGGTLIGPLKVWELDYPEDIEFKPEYLEIAYPDEALYKLD